jgi:hypothetical protein
MTNANFGGKVVLWCMDAMYPSAALDGAPYNGVALTPFNGKQMSSFIMSLDGCAEECVSYDFWSAITGQSGGTTYISSAASAGAGVADHWNNSTAKQYAKNLDPNANGIELVTVRPDSVNMGDLSYFVQRWLESDCASSNNYCDGADMNTSGAVDMKDYALLASHWLEGITS